MVHEAELTQALCFAILLIFLVVFLITRYVSQGRKLSPFLVEKPLELDTSLIDRRSRGVEGETIANHEFKVVKEFLGAGILTTFQFFPHGQQIHRFLDYFRIGGKIQFHPV
jgi:hypothetical protein